MDLIENYIEHVINYLQAVPILVGQSLLLPKNLLFLFAYIGPTSSSLLKSAILHVMR